MINALYYFLISKNMTGDISGDLDSYEGESTKYTNPILSEYFESSDDYWHIPLLSIGNVQGNGIFCRISIQNNEPSKLYISFRPLNLDGLDVLLKKNKNIDMITKFTKYKKLDLSQTKSLDNIIHQTQIIDDNTFFGNFGISNGIATEIMKENSQINVENWYSTLNRKKIYKPHMKELLNNKVFFTGNNKDKITPNTVKKNISILNAIVSFIKFYQPTDVIFTGFSLGSALAISTAYLVHLYLYGSFILDHQLTNSNFHIYQFCGPKVGNNIMGEYINKHFKSCYYYALSRNSKIDPVTYMPSTKFVHIGKLYVLDIINMILKPYNELSLTKKTSFNKLVLGFVLNLKMSEPFKAIHLAGEDLIERIFILKLIEANIDIPYITILPECKYFTSTGYSAKYKICPIKNKCRIISTTIKGKLYNKCE